MLVVLSGRCVVRVEEVVVVAAVTGGRVEEVVVVAAVTGGWVEEVVIVAVAWGWVDNESNGSGGGSFMFVLQDYFCPGKVFLSSAASTAFFALAALLEFLS